jgi:DNA-binding PadR family transcriptional regulator
MSLLEDDPRHPDELMQQLKGKKGGSARSLFPTLQELCDEGLVAIDACFGWRTYWLSEAGKAELQRESDRVKRSGRCAESTGQ